MALFDEHGEPSERWRSIERLLAEFEKDLDLTNEMCAALGRLGLFEPFTMQVIREQQEQLSLGGMYRISESRLGDLQAANHKVMVAKGYMSRIYAHLHSLQNFARLDRRRP